jgi:hypothetical protein
MLGSSTIKKDVVRFQPRFPLEGGTSYRATVRIPGSPPVTLEFAIPRRIRTRPPTSVTRVAPGRNVLPENLLKFYIEFSGPMSRGEAYEHLSLLNSAGKPIDLPFLELGEELWDQRGVRFTLLFDPGRIKTGLRPREEAGPVLEAGKSYTLVIDRAWRDAEGDPLASDFRKSFRVGPADATQPDPKTWTLERPSAGTKDPLVASFPRPLDRAMLGRVLGVIDASGKAVAGSIKVGDEETSWSLTPAEAWTPGRYSLIVDTRLEDVCGNSIARPFEVDVFDKVDRTIKTETVALPFAIELRGGQQREGRPPGR